MISVDSAPASCHYWYSQNLDHTTPMEETLDFWEGHDIDHTLEGVWCFNFILTVDWEIFVQDKFLFDEHKCPDRWPERWGQCLQGSNWWEFGEHFEDL